MSTIRIYFDGGCSPNPGRGYGSFEIIGEGIHERIERMRHGDGLGNNQAEYLTLIAALKRLIEKAPKFAGNLEIYTDSNNIVQQLGGRWKPHDPKIKVLVGESKILLFSFGLRVNFIWQGREHNVARFGH